MNNTRLASLFPTPLYSTEISISTAIKDAVTKFDFGRIPGGSANMSDNRYVLNEPGFEELRNVIDRHVQEFGHKIFSPADGIEFVLKNSWIMQHPPGDYNFLHFHANSIISGVIYINVHPKSGDIVFQKNVNNLQLGMLDIGTKEFNEFNSKLFSVTPVEGQLFIFPSNLYHRADSNLSSETRYCLPFNYFVKGILQKGGPEELVIL